MCTLSRRKSLTQGQVGAQTPSNSYFSTDTNALELADTRARLEPSHFHADTIYFWGEPLCSDSCCFERPPGWQRVSGVCLHVLECKCFAPAHLHVVLSMKHFYFQVAKNGEDFALNDNPVAKIFLSYFRRRQPLIPTLHAANHPPGGGKSPLVPPGLTLRGKARLHLWFAREPYAGA